MASITLTLPSYETITQGKQVTFKAPCGCKGIEALIINNENYTLMDASNNTINQADVFTKDAMVTVVLDVDKKRAYLQNGVTPHQHSADDITSGTLPIARGGTGATSLSNVKVGSADSATKATQDGSGNVITTTYATKAELNNKKYSADDINGGALTVDSISIPDGGDINLNDGNIKLDGGHVVHGVTGEQLYADYINVPLDTEVAVGEKFNGKQVYTYIHCIGYVPYTKEEEEKTYDVTVPIGRLVRFNAWAEQETSKGWAYSIPYVRGSASGLTEYVFVTLARNGSGVWKLHVCHKNTPDDLEKLYYQIWYTKD